MRASFIAIDSSGRLRATTGRPAIRRLGRCLVGLLALLTAGCSSDLPRSKAAQIIREQGKFPSYEEGALVLFSRGSDLTGEFEPLVHDGLVTVKMDPPWSNPYALPWMMGPSSRAVLTDKGKQFAAGEPYVPLGTSSETYGPLKEAVNVRFAIVEFGEITGITANAATGTSVVEYTVVRRPTPFGKAFNFTSETRIAQQTTFQKYDDGWRLLR